MTDEQEAAKEAALQKFEATMARLKKREWAYSPAEFMRAQNEALALLADETEAAVACGNSAT